MRCMAQIHPYLLQTAHGTALCRQERRYDLDKPDASESSSPVALLVAVRAAQDSAGATAHG